MDRAREKEKSDTNLVWFGSSNVEFNTKDAEEIRKSTNDIGRCHLLPSKGNPTESFCRQLTNRRKAERNSSFDIERCQFISIYCAQIAGTEIREKYFTCRAHSHRVSIDSAEQCGTKKDRARERERYRRLKSIFHSPIVTHQYCFLFSFVTNALNNINK